MAENARVLMIVGGGIAAYKSLLLVRLLRQAGIGVTPVLTRAGAEFVTPLSLAALAGTKCYTDLFSLTDEVEMGHIELSRSADLIVCAPATADLIGKAANGHADDLASTLLLATDKRVLFAPAMNVRMWNHPATRRNIDRLMADGASLIGPDEGEMACGEYGPGRLVEPENIFGVIMEALSLSPGTPAGGPLAARAIGPPAGTGAMAGRRVVVTAGPTHEPLDPVRYIANRSSGKQGYAIAEAFRNAGAHVTLVSGPVTIAPPEGVETIRVETARQMMEAVNAALPADVAVMCAAVADYRPAIETEHKIKKERGGLTEIALTENPDILASVARRKEDRPALVVGFAAETDDVVSHAEAKRVRKGCDFILANDVSPGTGVMGGDRNRIIFLAEDTEETWEEMSKADVAVRLVDRISEALEERS